MHRVSEQRLTSPSCVGAEARVQHDGGSAGLSWCRQEAGWALLEKLTKGDSGHVAVLLGQRPASVGPLSAHHGEVSASHEESLFVRTPGGAVPTSSL